MNTMQQEFDAVVEHLYKQGRPARKTSGGCLYRVGSMTCAVGCRIPDSYYDPEMEGSNVLALVDEGFTLPEEVAEYKEMFRDLQMVHDSRRSHHVNGNFDFGALEAGLRGVARAFGLTFTVPEAK